jgi:hypothetical protein
VSIFFSADSTRVEPWRGSHPFEYSMVADMFYCTLILSGSYDGSALNRISSCQDGACYRTFR